MSNQSTRRKLLVLSTGGSPRPLAYSIRMNRPDRVLFLASEASASSVNTGNDRDKSILELAEEFGQQLRPGQYTIVKVPHQELVPCVDQMRAAVHAEIEANGTGWEVILDFTGGTKTMSAALALAGQQFDARYCYVGASSMEGSRDKGGLGVTLDGRERHLEFENPHDATGFATLDDALLLYRSGAWAAGARLLRNRHGRMSDPIHKRRLDTWAHLGEAYAAWDRFLHREAAKSLSILQGRVEELGTLLREEEVSRLRELLDDHVERLEKLTNEGEQRLDMLVADLLANAHRRAAEGDFDEAILRLYRAVELCGSIVLEREHGVDASRPEFDTLPDAYIQETGLRRPVSRPLSSLGLQRAYQVLEAFGNPIGERFAELNLAVEGGGRSLLNMRNNSILLHGRSRASSRDWKELRYRVLRLLEVHEEQLVSFPFLSKG